MPTLTSPHSRPPNDVFDRLTPSPPLMSSGPRSTPTLVSPLMAKSPSDSTKPLTLTLINPKKSSERLSRPIRNTSFCAAIVTSASISNSNTWTVPSTFTRKVLGATPAYVVVLLVLI